MHSAEHWILAGLDLLYHKGEESLTIESLCKKLKLTKGSFYHHFKNREYFSQRLLNYWEKHFTDEIIRKAGEESTPQARLKILRSLTLALPKNTERAIRSWAFRNPKVKKIQERVDSKRIAFLKNAYWELSKDRRQADQKAKLAYAIFVGVEMILPSLDEKEIKKLYFLF
ncbi:TetR/AcrR family transcriptional regulator [Leptospira stimsonii]|uniref:TetR/AcrR family transcriptional regulator n=1 Tax=Leptospira stimsonii TaxID=2202203 RepID=A0ABY2NAY3_9LEPT|nr:TetR/AcrR family transcriptional regulator [Leptospira stimsonii]TGK10839.1 TetR/AcrR family transcriptional regulator [Leptospira stimsonii]TGM20342.1 TetR/AcrR family transcriptional regulator [Leptospira stimsonii]